MTRGAVERAYYFGCECVPGLTDQERLQVQCVEPGHVDQAFLDRYCSVDRIAPNQVVHTGTITRFAGVAVVEARCVLNWLARLFPQAAHATPGWSPPHGPQPLVA